MGEFTVKTYPPNGYGLYEILAYTLFHTLGIIFPSFGEQNNRGYFLDMGFILKVIFNIFGKQFNFY